MSSENPPSHRPPANELPPPPSPGRHLHIDSDLPPAPANERPVTRVARTLHALLTRLDEAAVDEWSRVAWLERLGAWVHHGPHVPRSDHDIGLVTAADPRADRIRLLLGALEARPAWAEGFARVVGRLLADARGVRFFSDVGLPTEPGFLREAFERVVEHVLPPPPRPNSIADLLLALFPTAADVEWIDRAPRHLIAAVIKRLYPTTTARLSAWRHLRASMLEAIDVLAARVCAQGLAQDVRDRLPPGGSVHDLAFVRLPRACNALGIDPSGDETGGAVSPAAIEAARAALADCRQAVADVLAHLDAQGVSVDLVYRLDLITVQLGRLEELLGILVPGFSSTPPPELGEFMSALLQAQYTERSVRALMRQATARLARKIIERTGHSGEHYITSTRAGWFGMLRSASGGGVLTAGTTVLKFLIAAAHLPMFFTGLFASVNYAGSFLLMQRLHFTLATKQPSMTAAALAGSLERNARRGTTGGVTATRRLDRMVDMMAQIARSQFAAALGNITAVIPAALAFDLVVRLVTHHAFLGRDKAHHVIESFHVVRSGTIPYAALTGVLLWLASVAAGWLENWTVYRRIPEAIARSRWIGALLGRRRAAALADGFAHGVSGFGGNVALGFLLGMVPMLGAFFGLPLDVRHVTLSTGGLTLAGSAAGLSEVLTPGFAVAVVGVLLIGVLNFGVSFVLAIAVALRAREIRRADFELLMRTVWARLRKHPREFFLPPRASAPVASSATALGAAGQSAAGAVTPGSTEAGREQRPHESLGPSEPPPALGL